MLRSFALALRLLSILPVALIIAACGLNSRPVTVADHPPAADLRCQAEPPAPAEDASVNDALAFDGAALLAGRDCRDALARTCSWHVERGAKALICAPRD